MRLSKTSKIFHTFAFKLECQRHDWFQAVPMHTVCVIFIPCFCYYYSQRLEIRAQVADAFLAKFQLTSEEMSLLRGVRDGPITEVSCFGYRHLKCSSGACYREK